MVTANPLYQYNPGDGSGELSGAKYRIDTITRLGIHFGYKVPHSQKIFILKYIINIR